MSKVIMIGCDLHDRSMLIRFAIDKDEPQQLSFSNDARGRKSMVTQLKTLAEKINASRIVFAYEASGLGFGLCDMLFESSIECHVLSPNLLPKTPKSAKLKTDAKDAQMLLEQVRGHVLAGNQLPVVWTPPQRLRDDRELVRARIDACESRLTLPGSTVSIGTNSIHPTTHCVSGFAKRPGETTEALE